MGSGQAFCAAVLSCVVCARLGMCETLRFPVEFWYRCWVSPSCRVWARPPQVYCALVPRQCVLPSAWWLACGEL
eukprot:scaffold91031_cov32-Tisochrysis_lutea.AAC.1